MLDTALLLLETAINTALKTDLQTIARLQDLQHKKIKLHITDWNIIFFIVPQHHGVTLYSKIVGEPDTVITGTLENLIKVGMASNKQHAMKQHAIQFSGDAHTGMAMQQLLRHLDIDWEEHLARLIGDAPTTIISKGIHAALSIGKSILNSVARNTSDYIHHEAQLSPQRTELETFYEKISQLRNDTARLEAHINLLKKQRGN